MTVMLIIAGDADHRSKMVREFIANRNTPNTRVVLTIQNASQRIAGNVVNLNAGTGDLTPALQEILNKLFESAEATKQDVIAGLDMNTESKRINFLLHTAPGHDVVAVVCDDTKVSECEGFSAVLQFSDVLP